MKIAKLTFLFIALIISEISFSQLTYEKEIFRNEPGKFADLDNDGIFDMVSCSNEINVHKGKQNLEYYLPKFVDTCTSVSNGAYSYYEFYLEDYNNDGLKDIICLSNSDNNILYYENKGNLNFQRHVLYSEVGEYRNFLVYDLNVDGKVDILFIKDNKFIYKTQLNGTLSADVIALTYSLSDNSLTTRDLNSDGRLDLVNHHPQGAGSYLNLDTNFFTLQLHISYNATTYNANDLYDFDGDGIVDMVTIDNSGLVYMHDNVIDYIPYSVPFNSSFLTFVQLDNDPEPEILIHNHSTFVYKIDYNSATNSFGPAILLGNDRLYNVEDINNDGFADVILAHPVGSVNKITFLMNDGLGNFTTHLPKIFSIYFAQAGDLDNDGLIDVVLASDYGVYWQKRLDQYEYSMPQLIANFSDHTDFKLGDLDNDGDLDIVFGLSYYLSNSSYDGIVYKLNDGNGNFGSSVMVDANANNATIMLADMDGNGFLDIVGIYNVGGQNQLRCYFNSNTSFTSTLIESLSVVNLKLFLLQDYNNNGTMDVICKRSNKIVNYEFNGSTFEPPVNLYSISSGLALHSYSDVDGDGDLDYLCTTSGGNNDVCLLKKEPTGLVYISLINNVPISNSLHFFDYDNDGDFDILQARSRNYFIYENDGLGNFTYVSSTRWRDRNSSFFGSYEGLTLKALYTRNNARRVREITHFNIGNQPVLSLGDTIYACPNENVTLNVLNNTELNDNIEWMLIRDSLNGSIEQVSTTGQFNFTTATTKHYYVRSSGGSNYQGIADSILVSVLPVSYGPISAISTCPTYLWPQNGVTYAATGNYYDTLTAVNGCDSLITLQLTILQMTGPVEHISSCQNYVWPQNGVNYTNSGIYYDTVLTINGCDSILSLDLTLYQPYIDTQNVTRCNSYSWPVTGLTYNLSGTYNNILVGQGGCDSILQLQLIIENYNSQINTFSMPSNGELCDGKVTIETFSTSTFSHTFSSMSNLNSNGSIVITDLCAGLYNLATIFGCGDTINQTVVIPIDTNFIINNWYPDSTAVDSLGYTIPNCFINLNDINTAFIDSIWYSGNIVHVVWSISSSTETFLITTSYSLNNGYGVYLLQLSVYCPYTPIGEYFSLSGEMNEYFTLTESIYYGDRTLNLNKLDQNDYDVAVYPNPTNDEVTLTFNTNQLSLKIINLLGQVVRESEVKSGEIISLAEFDSGMYLFEMVSENGVFLKRVIKN